MGCTCQVCSNCLKGASARSRHFGAAEASFILEQVARLLIIGLPTTGELGARPIGAYGAFLRGGLRARRSAFRAAGLQLSRAYFSAAQDASAANVA